MTTSIAPPRARAATREWRSSLSSAGASRTVRSAAPPRPGARPAELPSAALHPAAAWPASRRRGRRGARRPERRPAWKMARMASQPVRGRGERPRAEAARRRRGVEAQPSARDDGERTLAADDERHEIRPAACGGEARRPHRRRSRTPGRRPCPRSCRRRPSTARRSARDPSADACCKGWTRGSARA